MSSPLGASFIKSIHTPSRKNQNCVDKSQVQVWPIVPVYVCIYAFLVINYIFILNCSSDDHHHIIGPSIAFIGRSHKVKSCWMQLACNPFSAISHCLFFSPIYAATKILPFCEILITACRTCLSQVKKEWKERITIRWTMDNSIATMLFSL